MLVLGLLACTGPATPTAPAPLVVEVLSASEASECASEAELVFELGLPEDLAGQPARLESPEGDVLWEGSAASTTEVVLTWMPARGPVRAALTVGEQTVAVELPYALRPLEAPEILAIGLWTGGAIADQDAIDAASQASPWVDGVSVTDFPAAAVEVRSPHADLGVDVTVEARICPDEGACQTLPATLADGVWQVDLGGHAAARCAEPGLVWRDLFELHATSACGGDTGSFTARVVLDDCDGDGRIGASDCDDGEPGVGAPGDISVDGQPASTLAEAVAAGSDIVLCGGSHPGGLVIDGDVAIRSVGPDRAVLTALPAGSTLRVLDGHVVLAGLRVEGGAVDPGPSGLGGGGAIDAEGAASLLLQDLELAGGSAGRGGLLLGPANGAFTAEGGLWSGGFAIDGGAAWLAGGELHDVSIATSTASARGGGVFATEPVVLIDVRFDGTTAEDGGGLWLEHTDAQLAGCELVDTEATRDGGGLGAVLDPGDVLDLRPSIVDLTLLTFEGTTAGARGGGLFVEGGQVQSVILDLEGTSAPRGGGLFLLDSAWEDSATTWTGPAATDGAAVLVSGGSGVLVDSAIVGGIATSGAVYVEAGAVVDLVNTEVSSTGCGAWIAEGTLNTTGTTGANTPADVCGSGFESPFAPVCTEAGC